MRALPENMSASTLRLNPEIARQVGVVGKASGFVVPSGLTAGESKLRSLMEALPVRFTIWGEPMGAPRQSRRDAWKPRECVLRYRAWKDKARASAPENLPAQPYGIRAQFYLPMPPSWSKRKQAEMAGKPHRAKPDWDNLAKALCDALWEEDGCIASGVVTKTWCRPEEARVEVEVIP